MAKSRKPPFHRDESSVMLCYVGHHDPAYDCASRRKIDRVYTDPYTRSGSHHGYPS
jgi:hypothetical protein